MTAVAVPLPPDAERLLTGLVRVGAFDPERIEEVGRQFLEACPNGDATLLADHLAQTGLLTAFQAERALVEGPEKLELGRYLLIEPVGSGSVGTTFRAVSRADSQRYAVRVLPLRSSWRVLQARKRLETFATLPEHPAIVPFTDVDSAAGRHYLAWPWADGQTFDRLVLKNGPLTPMVATRLFAELADGLHVLHTAGIPHGLLRPRSLLLGHDRQPRLLDLGLGGILADSVADERSMVDTLALASGSAAMADYTAPETLLDPTIGSPSADAYSFGCCLYFALTGFPPFPDERLSDKVVSHQTRSPVPVSSYNPSVPPPLTDLLERLMRKASDERPQNFADVRTELRAIAELSESSAEPTASKAVLTVQAEALAALGESTVVSLAFTRRADLPPASDVINFDDFPIKRVAPPLEQDEDEDAPPAPAVIRSPKLPVPPTTEKRLLAADAGANSRPPVEIPPPPAFDHKAARAARSLLFWKKPTDTVQLSVFGPPTITPGQRAKLLVYAHLPEAFSGVATLCRALNPDTELLGSGYIQRLIPRDSPMQLHLTVGDGSVPKPLVDLTWTGQTQPRSFDVLMPRESAAGWTAAMLSAGWERQKVAEVPFQVLVNAVRESRPGR